MLTTPDEVGVATAQDLLGITSIDKEFDSLKKRVAKTQFKFDPSAKRQKLRPYQINALTNL